MNATVTLKDVSVSFHNRPVLKNVDAFFPANRISVLVGRSGSGKTTLLRALNRLNEEFPGCATSGTVQVDFGQGPIDIYAQTPLKAGGIALPELRLRVGMLFQTPNCLPVSVYRNLALPLKLAGGAPAGEIAGRVQAALEATDLWREVKDRLDTPAEQLSGGQQQRLCLARLLALRPAVLLLDEPAASLDVHAAGKLEELLRELAAQYTIIMVSHELAQARRLADQVLVCSEGVVSGPVGDIEQLSEDKMAELLLCAQREAGE